MKEIRDSIPIGTLRRLAWTNLLWTCPDCHGKTPDTFCYKCQKWHEEVRLRKGWASEGWERMSETEILICPDCQMIWRVNLDRLRDVCTCKTKLKHLKFQTGRRMESLKGRNGTRRNFSSNVARRRVQNSRKDETVQRGNPSMTQIPKEFLADRSAVEQWLRSKCRNCGRAIRLQKSTWCHVEMYGGNYGQYDESCKELSLCAARNAELRLITKPCTLSITISSAEIASSGIRKMIRSGSLTKEMKQKIESQASRYELKYGDSCSVVITKHGIFFEDIC